jgi:glycosyltransferase involved in cell wall biosynthesis
MKLSVIIPVYNYGRYLIDAFQSVAFEMMKDKEVILVNDGSTDDTANIINEIARPFNYSGVCIRCLDLTVNQGVSVARNFGLSRSKGEYITFLDADDMRVPGSLELQCRYLDRHKSVDVVFGEALEIRGGAKYYMIMNKIRSLRVHPAKVNPQTVMYRRSVFEKYGGWYERLLSGEDKEMSMRLGIHPESPFNFVKVKKLKNPIALYRKHMMEKHKRRKADEAWNKETKRIQKERLKQLKREGITRENTCFPI